MFMRAVDSGLCALLPFLITGLFVLVPVEALPAPRDDGSAEHAVGVTEVPSGATMERFRRRCSADFDLDPAACVGVSAGLSGDCSLFAGLPTDEALAAGWAGPGYGNSWCVIASRSFDYTGGDVSLSFDYVLDTEPGQDFVFAVIDTSASPSPPGELPWKTIWAEDGALQSGSAVLQLKPGVELPSCSRSIRIGFYLSTDGAWSSEDGFWPTPCGAVAIDDFSLSGGINYTTGFETDDGWEESQCGPGFGQPCFSAPEGAFAWWPFDEDEGALSTDIIGGRVATHLGAPALIAGIYDVGRSMSFEFGGALEIPDEDALDFGTGDFSWTMMVRSRPGPLLSKWDSVAERGYELRLVDGGGQTVRLTLGDGISRVDYDLGSMFTFTRHVLTLTVARNSSVGVRLYIDGVLSAAMSPAAVGGDLGNTMPLRLGGENTGSALDELMLFDRVIDESEVAGIDHQFKLCNHRAHLPWVTPFCELTNEVEITALLCNNYPDSGIFDLSFGAHPVCDTASIGGCDIAGPETITVLDPLPVSIGSGACTPLRVRIQRPASMTASPGQLACYTATMTNLLTDRSTTSVGRLVDGGILCGTPQVLPNGVGSPYPLPPHQTLTTGFGMDEFIGGGVDVEYEIVTRSSDGRNRVSTLSLDGLAPGSPTSGTIAVNRSLAYPGTTPLPLNLRFARAEPTRLQNAVLMVGPEANRWPLASLAVRTVGTPAAVAAPAVTRRAAFAKLRSERIAAGGGSLIHFEVLRSGAMELAIYNAAGRHVRTLHHGELGIGDQSFVWAGEDARGVSVARGLYLARLAAGGQEASTKLLLLH